MGSKGLRCKVEGSKESKGLGDSVYICFIVIYCWGVILWIQCNILEVICLLYSLTLQRWNFIYDQMTKVYLLLVLLDPLVPLVCPTPLAVPLLPRVRPTSPSPSLTYEASIYSANTLKVANYYRNRTSTGTNGTVATVATVNLAGNSSIVL